jgi:GT2 family glycosyltransferase
MPSYLDRLEPGLVAARRDLGGFRPSESFSVVVVAWRTNERLLRCLDSLSAQADRDFETILVDNGGNEAVTGRLGSHPVRHLRMARNVGCCAGRNVGLVEAAGEIVFFLDDDDVATPGLVAACRRAFRERARLIGLRGRGLPVRPNIYAHFRGDNDLGDEVKESHIDLECVCAFRREALLRVGGWNSDLPNGQGHEGLELSWRLFQAFGPGRLIYHPEVLIERDDREGLHKFIRKNVRHYRNWRYLRAHRPGLEEWVAECRLKRGSRDPIRPAAFPASLQFWVLKRLKRLIKKHPTLQDTLARIV